MEAIFSNLSEISKNDPFYLGIDSILKSYDFAKSPSKNIHNMESSYNKDQLYAAVYYVKSLQTEYPAIVQRVNQRKSRNKNNLAGDISIFVNGLQPIKCLSCNSDYIHAAAENSQNNSVFCLLCNRYSHKQCFKKENIPPGLSFICSPCHIKNTSQDTNLETEKTDDHQTPPSQNSANKSHPPVSPTQPNQSQALASPVLAAPPPNRSQSTPQPKSTQPEEPDESTANEDSLLHPYQTPKSDTNTPKVDEEKSEEWCKLYLEGICPHGISGKGCSSTHPKRCNKYSKHGEERYRGCRRGKNCKYFHPRLCKNSTEMRVCLARTCKDVHLLGTQRFKPSGNYQHTESQQNHSSSQNPRQHHRSRFQQNRISPWQQSHNPSHSSNEAEKHFLVQYLENMRADLTKSIEMKFEAALQRKTDDREGPHQTSIALPEPSPADPQPQHRNPYQPQPNPSQTMLAVSRNQQFQPQHQPMNLSQPLHMQTPPNPPFLQMYQ